VLGCGDPFITVHAFGVCDTVDGTFTELFGDILLDLLLPHYFWSYRCTGFVYIHLYEVDVCCQQFGFCIVTYRVILVRRKTVQLIAVHGECQDGGGAARMMIFSFKLRVESCQNALLRLLTQCVGHRLIKSLYLDCDKLSSCNISWSSGPLLTPDG
jgi:hypothetical protein